MRHLLIIMALAAHVARSEDLIIVAADGARITKTATGYTSKDFIATRTAYGYTITQPGRGVGQRITKTSTGHVASEAPNDSARTYFEHMQRKSRR